MGLIRNIRLYVDKELSLNKEVALASPSSHYLCNVMRCHDGDLIKCFNSQDGEFLCRICKIDKKQTIICADEQVRIPQVESDLWLLFAPLKKDKTDFVIEKAVELGVSRIVPIITAYTNSDKVKLERFAMQAVEAAEQCERLSVPTICQPQKLNEILKNWDTSRKLFFMDERRQGQDIIKAFQTSNSEQIAILIGPEGGFSDEEASMLNNLEYVKNINLGPRILRAETAVAASLAIYQACCGDWNKQEEKQ